MSLRGSIRELCVAGALVVLATVGSAQKGASQKKDSWQLDPYTMADPAAMQRVGYVSFGPFPWGDDHDSRKIHAMMPEAKLLWVETAHFRIGSTLASIGLPKASKSKRRLKGELKQLREKLPKIKSSPRRIDRWLRVHLYADRLERLYTECQQLLGVTDASFPTKKPAGQPQVGDPAYMGIGPYLGMSDKFTVLLMQKAANLTRYGTKNGQPEPKDPQPIAINFHKRGGMFFGTSSEIVYHSEDTDHRLHAHIRFNIGQQLIRGFRSYSHAIPAWVEEGTANTFVIGWDPTQHEFSGMRNWNHGKHYPAKWAANCRKLAKNGFYSRSAKLCTARLSSEFTFNDQMCAWSRVDFLRTIDGGKKFAEFFALLNAPMAHEPATSPTFATVLTAQEAALKTVFGFDWDGFDAAWKAYALAKYPRR